MIHEMRKFGLTLLLCLFSALVLTGLGVTPAAAQEHSGAPTHPGQEQLAPGAPAGDAHGGAPVGADPGHANAPHEQPGVFDPHAGTWLNPVARRIFGLGAPQKENHGGETAFTNVKYDYLVVAALLMLLLAAVAIAGARRLRLRPEGKPSSLPNLVEAAAEGYQNYLIGIMGRALALKYTPLIATFFFTILLFNYAGLVPGLMSPTANPNVPFALAIVGFFAVHIIAIREAGVKNWFLHFVGEPLWMAPLNFPLHLIGELVKPVSLAFRLLGNVFGEEVVIAQLTLLGMGIIGAQGWLPGIPVQLPMLFLSVFFGALQALVFSTLLAIYISIFCTHGGHEHGHEHGHGGHVEHDRTGGHDRLIAHPTEVPIA
ncbi:MAG TPA: F0F1 ATP synthase subunit A [Abditibacteriaceae bacterium]